MRCLQFFLRCPISLDIVNRRLAKLTRAPEEISERHLLRRREVAGFAVGFGGDDVDADHRVRTVELFRRLEPAAIDFQRRQQLCWSEMRGERIGQSEFGREIRAVGARSEDPQRHIRSRRRNGLNPLCGGGRSKEGLQFQNVLRERVGGRGLSPQRLHGDLIGAGSPSEPKVDTAGKKPREGSELFSDDDRRMGWEA